MKRMKVVHLAVVLAATLTTTATVGQTRRAGPDKMYPNPTLTPGAINPEITQSNIAQTICHKGWKTGTERDKTTSEAQKEKTYKSYNITPPPHDTGQDQECELDHLISLENGGADSIENIWPQCGPDWPTGPRVPLEQRYFKMKDAVENYVHNGICLNVPDAKFSEGPKPPSPLTLAQGQAILKGDWYACYEKMKQGKACE
jgi:hypothetical protein